MKIVPRFMLTPFAKRNIRVGIATTLGYSEYFIFGIRVAYIQKTQPWD